MRKPPLTSATCRNLGVISESDDDISVACRPSGVTAHAHTGEVTDELTNQLGAVPDCRIAHAEEARPRDQHADLSVDVLRDPPRPAQPMPHERRGRLRRNTQPVRFTSNRPVQARSSKRWTSPMSPVEPPLAAAGHRKVADRGHGHWERQRDGEGCVR